MISITIVLETLQLKCQADLVLLEANPLEDITNTRLITGVMVRGRWYTRNYLNIMLDKIAEANKEVSEELISRNGRDNRS